jgi:hypothetical protein
MNGVDNFRIPHLAHEKVELRLGFHSGSFNFLSQKTFFRPVRSWCCWTCDATLLFIRVNSNKFGFFIMSLLVIP